MKTSTAVLIGFITAVPAFCDPAKVLLLGSPGAVIRRAIVDDRKISADAIVYDEKARVLRCSGAVEIQSGVTTEKKQDCTIELGAAPVFYLNSEGIQVPSKKASGRDTSAKK